MNNSFISMQFTPEAASDITDSPPFKEALAELRKLAHNIARSPAIKEAYRQAVAGLSPAAFSTALLGEKPLMRRQPPLKPDPPHDVG